LNLRRIPSARSNARRAASSTFFPLDTANSNDDRPDHQGFMPTPTNSIYRDHRVSSNQAAGRHQLPHNDGLNLSHTFTGHCQDSSNTVQSEAPDLGDIQRTGPGPAFQRRQRFAPNDLYTTGQCVKIQMIPAPNPRTRTRPANTLTSNTRPRYVTPAFGLKLLTSINFIALQLAESCCRLPRMIPAIPYGALLCFLHSSPHSQNSPSAGVPRSKRPEQPVLPTAS